MESCDQRYKQGADAGDLENIIDGRKRPVVLGGEDEMHEEHNDKSEDHASEEDLHGKRTRKGGSISEVRICSIPG